MFNKEIHRFFFLLGTIVISIAFPFSPFLLSLGSFVLAGNWLAEFNFKHKLSIVLERKSISLFILIYLLHVIWLINSTNLTYALHDLKIKLPLLILPLIYGTTNSLNQKELKLILHFFLAAMLSSTFLSILILLGLTPINPTDIRSLSPFISHIRLALLLVLSCYIILSFLICSKHLKYMPGWVYLILLIWFLFFLLFLGASTGIVIALLCAPAALIFWLNSKDNSNYRRLTIASILAVVLFSLVYMSVALIRFLEREPIVAQNLEKYTINGNRYNHYISNSDYENSHRVWIYVCDKELKTEWNNKSDFSYEGKDKNGQLLRATLMRYMASMGLRKDSLGFSALSQADIKMIEDGFTNQIYKKKFSVYPRVYQLYWEIENYLKYGNPSGHSLTQRIEYVKNAIRVIQRHFWFGTGTGDVDDEIKKQYEIDKSILEPKWQLRAHNQIITTFLTLGFIGFILSIVLLFSLIKRERNNIDFIAFIFLAITVLSFLNEDTLETQAGVNFFAFFFSLFIFGRKNSGS